ncbi:hypothetical protein ACOSP7_019679 [Xanthoceras sorbifolium]
MGGYLLLNRTCDVILSKPFKLELICLLNPQSKSFIQNPRLSRHRHHCFFLNSKSIFKTRSKSKNKVQALYLEFSRVCRVGSESSQVGAELTEPLTSVGEVANLLQRSRKEASVVEVEAEAEDEVEVVVMDEIGILTAVTSTTTRKEKAQQEAVGEAIQTRGTINLKEEPSLTIEVRVSSSSAIPLIQKVTSYTTRTTKSL